MVLLVVVLFVVVALAAVAGLTVRNRLTGLPRQVVAAAFDSGAADTLRRDVAGALTRRVAPNVFRPGGILMRGKAAKHFALAGHTLFVRADPNIVADLVAPAILAARAKFRPSDTLEPGEVAAWEADSIFGAFPRLVVRHSRLLAGSTELGAPRPRVSMRFPQGGPFVERGVTAARSVLCAAGLIVRSDPRVRPRPRRHGRLGRNLVRWRAYCGTGTWTLTGLFPHHQYTAPLNMLGT